VLHPEVILNRIAARTMPSSELRLNLMGPSGPEAEKTIRLANGTWLYRSPLEAIGTQWIFECSLPASATGHRSSAALAIGLFITALVTSQLLLLANRTRRIEAEVHARTEDLRVANTRLEENFRERARLEEEMHELAAREQRRIGRDLHDSLGQKLTGAVFLSRSLLDYFSNSKNQGSGDGDQRSEVGRQSEIVNRKSSIGNQETHARTLNETLKDAVAQVRNMARGLAPVTLNDESLCEALSQLAEEMTGLYGVSCEVTECTEPPALDRKIKEQLYLIAREAVNNAARHAQAGHVTLRLTGSESGWKLCVEDDGKGLAEKQPSDEGMGIRIMRHRASLIGADFSISSASGQGTCVDVISNM
jgi:signal transduction histidine kinase